MGAEPRWYDKYLSQIRALMETGEIDEEEAKKIVGRHSAPAGTTAPNKGAKEDEKILERLIVATGITQVNSNITSVNFGITEEPDDRELVLSHPNKLASTEEVHAFMSGEGVQPEGPDYLARYAKKNPGAGLQFPIVALDPNKLWLDPYGSLCCVVLWGRGGVRGFGLGWAFYPWPGHFRFLGSRKPRP